MTVYVIIDAQDRIVTASLDEDMAKKYAAPIRGYKVLSINLMEKEMDWV